ncbi:uncharacterized protein LOC123303095, partial [Chrysoperla carnea]|uniref:uncharacterized protein LOC123303095 n=1 Tax=Chrysoperla carnea TaxID=189513 RepID=UPI001D07D87F
MANNIGFNQQTQYITNADDNLPTIPVNIHSIIMDISNQVALFRDLLINIGQTQDSPELREKIRKLRRNCVESCKSTSQSLILYARRHEMDGINAGIPNDDPHLLLLFFILQLFLRELTKCHRLVQVIPMDMTGYYDNRTGPSNLGNVISQILLCKQITPDFNREELCSITKDSKDIAKIIDDIQQYMPKQELNLERTTALGSGDFDWTKCHRGGGVFYK